MTLKSIIDCERKSLRKLERLQLPNGYKKIGIGLAIFSFLFLFVNKFTFDSMELRLASRYGLLVGMLLVSISKDKIEDELITKLRMQSYTFAFVIGVFFTLVQPFLNYFVDFYFDPNGAIFKDTGDFEVLWILLSIQVFHFELLKRFHQ